MKQGMGQYGRTNRALLHLNNFLSLIKDTALIQQAEQFWNACAYYADLELWKSKEKKKKKEHHYLVYPLILNKKSHTASSSAPKSYVNQATLAAKKLILRLSACCSHSSPQNCQ